MTERDIEYITAVLKGRTPKKEPEWYGMLGFLQFHRIAGLFYNRAKKQNIALPLKLDKLLGQTFECQRRRVRMMREHLKEVSAGMIGAGARHIALKGSVLANLADSNIYEDGERVSDDIDLLVSPTELTKVSEVLRRWGYIQGTYCAEKYEITPFSRYEILSRRMNRGEIAPFLKLTDSAELPYVEIDVNFSLGNTPEEGRVLLEAMLDSASVYDGKVRMQVADSEMFFLHLVMHQYKESCLTFASRRGKDLDLYKLADLYYLLKSDALDMKSLKTLTGKYELAQELGAVCEQVGKAFGDEEILELAEQYPHCQPEVRDYEQRKSYVWPIDIRARLLDAEAWRQLKEKEWR